MSVSTSQFNLACTECPANLAVPGARSVPVGFGPNGQIFRCAPGTGCQAAESGDPENIGDLTRRVEDRIAAAIMRAGRSRGEVAAAAGMTEDRLGRSLCHERGLFVTEVVQLALALELDPSALFEDSEVIR